MTRMPELTLTQMIVAAAGLLSCGFVLWFFRVPPRRNPSALISTTMQEVVIRVLGGYDPESVVLLQGIPAKLRFQRDEDAECSEELVIPDFSTRRTLPPFKTTTIDLQPDDLGEFPFHCGMGMLRGRIVVVAADEKT